MSGSNADETGSGSSSSGVTIGRAEHLLASEGASVGAGFAYGGAGGAIKKIAEQLQVKDELEERACSSLPPLVYDGKVSLR